VSYSNNDNSKRIINPLPIGFVTSVNRGGRPRGMSRKKSPGLTSEVPKYLSAAAELQMFCVMPFLSSTVELRHSMLSEELDWPKLSYAPIVSLPETVGIGAEM